MRRFGFLLRIAMVMGVSWGAIFSSALLAVDWYVTSGGSWTKPSNWFGGTIPNGIDAVANFAHNTPGNDFIITDATATVGTLILQDTGPSDNSGWQFNTPGTLTFQVSSGSALLNFRESMSELDIPVVLMNDLDITYTWTTTDHRANLNAAISSGTGLTTHIHINRINPWGTGSYGRVVFKGSNTFNGNVTIYAGTLQVQNGNAIPDTSNVEVQSGAMLRVHNSESINALNGNGGVIGPLGSGSDVTFTVGAGNGSGTFSGTIWYGDLDSGRKLILKKTGSGTQTFSGSLGRTGGTIVDGGTLVLAQSGLSLPSRPGSAGQFGTADYTITVNANATLQLDADWVTGDGLLTHVVVNGGTLHFGSGDNYLGNIELTAGKITTRDSGSPWRTGYLGNGLIKTNASGASSTIAGRLCFVGYWQEYSSITTFNVADGTAVDDLIVSAAIYDHEGYEGKMTLVKEGLGTMVLSGSNTYGGTTKITAGTLKLDGGAAIPDGPGKGNVVLDAGSTTAGTLDLNGSNETINGLSGTSGTVLGRVVNNKSGTTAKLTVGAGDASATFAGILADNTGTGGTLQLTKIGSGTQTLTGPLNYTGGTTVEQGTLQLGASNVLPDTGAISVSGGTLDIGSYNDTVGPVTLAGGTITGTTGVLTGSSYEVRKGTVSAILGGTGNLTKTTTDTVTLSGPLNYTGGTTVNGGTLVLARSGLDWTPNGQFGSSGHVLTVNADATLQLTKMGLLGNGQSHQLVINGGTVEFLHQTYQSKIQMTGGKIISTPSEGIKNVWRTGNYGNGEINILASATGSQIEGRLSFVKSASATKTTFDVEDGSASVDLLVSADIVDHSGYEGMELVKAGAGTMVLSGTNTYLGPTTIQGGKLLLNGTHSPGTTPGLYTVGPGGTLGGTGTTTASVLLQGAVTPGASVGTLHTGSETWTPGGTYQWEIQDVDAGPGTGWDLVNIIGTLTITATPANPFVIDVVSLGVGGEAGLVGDFNPLGVYEWEIARTTAGVSGFASEKFTIALGNFQNNWHGGRWFVTLGGEGDKSVFLNFLNYAIPEPASGVLAALGLLGLLLWQALGRRK